MRFFSKESARLVLWVQFLVILVFLIGSISFLTFYGIKLFSSAKNIVFVQSLESEQRIFFLEFFQEKPLLWFYGQKKYPIIANVFISKIEIFPPTTIKIYTQKRNPLAYFIQKEKTFAIDSEGVVFFIEKKKTKELAQLVFGFQKIQNFFQTTRGKELLKLLVQITTNEHFLKKKISTIFLENSLNIAFVMIPNDLPILLGYDFFEEKIRKLDIIFSKLNGDFSNIKQIDARYQDKIILEHK